MKWYHIVIVTVVIAIIAYILYKLIPIAKEAQQTAQQVGKAIETSKKLYSQLTVTYPSLERIISLPTWSPTWVASPMTIPAQYLGEQLGKLLWGQR